MPNYLEEFFDARKAKKQLSPEEKLKAEKKGLEDQRQRIINFKKFFGEDHGKSVMIDLMNKFHVLGDLPRLPDGSIDPVAEGHRQVVVYLLKRANVSVEQLDRILKGDFV